MTSDCLSFNQIPHTSRLFRDFLYATPNVQRFYPHGHQMDRWLPRDLSHLHYDSQRRERVAAVLERQNRAFGSSERTMESLRRLREGAATITTGQQVTLYGGPLFAILKAISAIALAEEATRRGLPTVPVFWMATEDHDLAEVNHATFVAADGSIHRLETPSHGIPDSPVGTVRLGAEIEPVTARAAELLGESEAADWVRESYRPGETMGSAFGKLFARIFQDHGVVLLDALDPQLHREAAPVYRAAAVAADDLDKELLERGSELRAREYHEQVKVTPSSTLLFRIEDGQRRVIHRSNGDFVYGERKIPRDQLLADIEQHPEDYSANVLLRPVVQDFLLPNLAYIGGPAEVAYFAQGAVVYEQILGRVTAVLPRFSATIVDARAQRHLKRYHLQLTDLFHGPERLRDMLALRSLPEDLQLKFDRASEAVEGSLHSIRSTLNKLDPTLVEAAAKAGSKMLYQLRRLGMRAAHAELRKSGEISRHADELSAALFPEKGLQERHLAGICYVGRHGRQLIADLKPLAQANCPDHKVVYV